MTLKFHTTEEVKERFITFFMEHNHQLVPPKGIIPIDDPTLLFINSGMAPMKPFFMGKKTPPSPMLTNVQDCIRFVDFDDVGDSYHGTSFRMMGSWSFGDYFKEGAIKLAFELITEGFGLDPSKLSATVFKNDGSIKGVPDDEESARIWEKYLPRDRIIPRPPVDNFWGPPGDSGPCGPCTEVFYDRGPEYTEKETDDILVPGRHIEIWNAGVFMEYYMSEQKEISNLPNKCVDTGAGQERFAMILQNTPSICEIDQYRDVYRLIHEQIKNTTWSRIALDHLKTSILILREGVIPSNTREGYMLRRLLRKALIGMFIHEIRFDIITTWSDYLCDVIDNKNLTMEHKAAIDQWIKFECNNFAALMKRSRRHLNKVITLQELTAQKAFELKTSIGIPEELLHAICETHNIDFPTEGFNAKMEEHRNISRKK